jgi:2-dehydro-3-deoxyphosphogluconate aldolase/(4S)-4-hydroxy-2-oxoglutarate aldolase
MADASTTLDAVAARGPVIPVLQFDGAEQAVAVCHALQEGGISVVEITLRTTAALSAIEAVADHCKDMMVGAGTILEPAQMAAARDAGATFAVSPGFTPALADAARRIDLAFLPGVATASEILAARAAGFRRLKFFPAEAAGGPRVLSAMAGPFADIRFCPTGGIRADNAAGYLALPNVMCVGGSWMAPAALVASWDYRAISALARTAAALPRG